MTTKYVSLEATKTMMKSHKEKLMGLDNGVIQMLLVDLISLPTLEIDTLQRYDMKVKGYTTLQYESYEVPSDNGEYVKYSDLVELLNR